MIQPTQRKMFRFIIQPKRQVKTKTQDNNEDIVTEEVGKQENEKDDEEKKKKKKKKTMGTLKMKLMMETAQTKTAIKTATSPS